MGGIFPHKRYYTDLTMTVSQWVTVATIVNKQTVTAAMSQGLYTKRSVCALIVRQLMLPPLGSCLAFGVG